MEYLLSLIFVSILGILGYQFYNKLITSKREGLIDTFQFPDSLGEKIAEKYPHLNENQVNHVLDGLREYFHLCNIAGRRMVSMPSQVVDVAWHEFILFTRQYDLFCKKALGRFLHHTPAEAMRSPTVAQKGIKTAWRTSCFREGIEAKSAKKLPLLFAIDTKLGIPDGFSYSLDCLTSDKRDYCAGHIGCGSGCAGGCGGDSGCGGGGGGCGGD